MKVAILADIHANIEALEAVLLAADKAGAQRFVVLGDIVGYGPDPVACIYRLQEVGAIGLLGNHDQALVEPECLVALNHEARQTLLLSRDLLGPAQLSYLASLAFRHVEWGGVFTHANPIAPEGWEHLYLHEQVAWCLRRMDWQVGFVGHTHIAAIYCKIGDQIVSLTSAQVAVGRHQFLINPGSVGQPRDRDSRASFALWDLDLEHVELRRVEYPVRKTQAKMAQAGWPCYATERLALGE
ncbi:MAG: hypothetical protein GKR89_09535 [Candidatus Latescibacteria bacterium]|nr:hypothetical protein [Candidatus Latescibacterota bacterium]